MMLTIPCAVCRATIEFGEEDYGGLTTCPQCNKEIQLPTAATFRRTPRKSVSRMPPAPHRANVVFTFAVIGIVLAPLAVAAYIMGKEDLEKMRLGYMDMSGKPETAAAHTLASVTCAVYAVGMAITLFYLFR